MTKQDIEASFDTMIKQNKALLKWTPIVGLVFLVIGGIMYSFVTKKDMVVIAQLLLGLGGFILCFFTPLFYFTSISTSKKIEKIKTILATEPKKLVWAYVYQITKNGVKNEFIIIKFRDGEELEIHKSNFKNDTLEDFLYSLKSNYNENITLGFSEEIKQKYLNGQL
jgi:hypothetical protein